jgi:hypothetical protein
MKYLIGILLLAANICSAQINNSICKTSTGETVDYPLNIKTAGESWSCERDILISDSTYVYSADSSVSYTYTRFDETSSGTYTFYKTPSDGMIDSISITVNEPLNVKPTIPADTSACGWVELNINKDNNLYNITDTSGYQWNNGYRHLYTSQNFKFFYEDSIGCSYQDSIQVTINKTPYVTIQPYSSDVCFGDSLTMYPSLYDTLTNLSYQWSRGNINEVISNDSAVTIGHAKGVDFEEYMLVVTSEQGCSAQDTTWINYGRENKKESLQLCSGRDTSIFVGDNRANPVWSNGSAEHYLPVKITENTIYTVHSRNYRAYSCENVDTFDLEVINCDSVYFISGTVFSDANKNGIQDAGEQGLAQVKVENSNPYQITYTEWDGSYEYAIYKGVVTTVSNNLNSDVHTISSVGHMPGESTGNNFPVQSSNEFSNLSISKGVGRLRPGFTSHLSLCLWNYGPVTAENTVVKLAVDPFLTLNIPDSLNKYMTSFDNDTLAIALGNMPVNIRSCFYFTVDVPAGEEHLGKTVNIYSSIFSDNFDPQLHNNVCNGTYTIGGSYDPNHKEASVGDGAIGLDVKDLTYTVQFQNTGTDTAFTVVLVDTLDLQYFDLQSFEMIGSSHDYNLHVDSAGVANWTFNNILLVDSITNEALSHGHVTFKINLKESIALNENITNKASIYFDFNSPIVTNTAVNYYAVSSSVRKLQNSTMSLYPNPTTSVINVQTYSEQADNLTARINDVSGQIVMEKVISVQVGQNTSTFNISSLASGVYYISIRETFLTQRFVKK